MFLRLASSFDNTALLFNLKVLHDHPLTKRHYAAVVGISVGNMMCMGFVMFVGISKKSQVRSMQRKE